MQNRAGGGSGGREDVLLQRVAAREGCGVDLSKVGSVVVVHKQAFSR